MGSRSPCASADDFASLSASDSVEVGAANARSGRCHSSVEENAPAEASAELMIGLLDVAHVPAACLLHAKKGRDDLAPE